MIIEKVTINCPHEASPEYVSEKTRQRQQGNMLKTWIKCPGCNVTFLTVKPLVENGEDKEGPKTKIPT